MAEVHLAEEPKCLTLPRIKMNSRQAEQAMQEKDSPPPPFPFPVNTSFFKGGKTNYNTKTQHK